MTLESTADIIHNVLANIDGILTILVDENSDSIAKYNTDQMWEGQRADGSDISPLYTPYTIKLKKLKGQPTDRVTLKDSGAFYDSLFAKYQNGTLTLFDNDSKAIELMAKYGDEILGLNDDNLEKVFDLLSDSLTTYINNELQ